MNRRSALKITTLIALGSVWFAGNATPQQSSLKQQLVGTWTMSSVVDVYENDKTVDYWGRTVTGAASFDTSGRYTWMIIGADLPTASGSPRVSSRMVIAYFGKYAVDDAKRTITFTVERSTYPDIDGTSRKASVTIKGDEMIQDSSPLVTPRGTITPRVVFKRAK
jgi:hypothetical protein